jgi:hypothetical protein
MCRITSDTTASAHPKASGGLAHPRYSRRWRLSSHVGSCRDPIGISSAGLSNAPCRASYDPVVSNQPRSAQSNEYEMCCGKTKLTRKFLTRHPPAAQLGRSQAALSRGIIVPQRVQAESAASQSPERPAVRNGDGATTRQIVRTLGHGKLVTQPMRSSLRGDPRYHSCSAAQQH